MNLSTGVGVIVLWKTRPRSLSNPENLQETRPLNFPDLGYAVGSTKEM